MIKLKNEYEEVPIVHLINFLLINAGAGAWFLDDIKFPICLPENNPDIKIKKYMIHTPMGSLYSIYVSYNGVKYKRKLPKHLFNYIAYLELQSNPGLKIKSYEELIEFTRKNEGIRVPDMQPETNGAYSDNSEN